MIVSAIRPSMPFFIPYTLSMSSECIAPKITPASVALIAAVGPPDCPTIAFPLKVDIFYSFALLSGNMFLDVKSIGFSRLSVFIFHNRNDRD